MRTFFKAAKRAGSSLPETLVTVAITAVATGSLYVGSTALHKSFRAARHYAESQASQLRVIDYIARDLRRATGWPTATTSEIQLTIPNYFETSSSGNQKPRQPKVGSDGGIYYGTNPQDVLRVRYFTTPSTVKEAKGLVDIHRSVTSNGVTDDRVIVRGADNFEISFDPSDPKKQIVRTKITFPPNFRPFVASSDIYRDGTATYSSTLVRNKR